MQFTAEQEQIISNVNGKIITVSTAGSGKTTSMLARIENMIVNHDIPPENITMVTFTKAAAEEMEKRFNRNRKEPWNVNFSTIHSLCFKILHEDKGLQHYQMLEEWRVYKFFREELKKVKGSFERLEEDTKKIVSEISFVRNAAINLNNYKPEFKIMHHEDIFFKLYHTYEQFKRANSKYDFDDLIILTLYFLKNEPRLLEKWQDRIPYIIVDEFQDTNKIQANIFYLLSQKYGNLCVVGDDDQSIYGFRSADSSIMLNFENVFQGAKKLSLSTNYRSCKKVVEMASNLISYNLQRFDKKIIAASDVEGVVDFVECRRPDDETEKLIDEIKSAHKKGVAYKDMAILFRVNKQAVPLVSLLHKEDIPFFATEKVLDIHKEFYFQDLLAYYHLSKGDPVKEYLPQVLNHPNRFLTYSIFKECDLSDESIEKCCKQYAFGKDNKYNSYKRRQSLSSMEEIKWIIEDVKGRKPSSVAKIVFDTEYRSWLREYAKNNYIDPNIMEAGLNAIIKEAATFDTMEEWEEYAGGFEEIIENATKNKDGVVLSTFHGAKGLEWNNVYIIGAAEGLAPFGSRDAYSLEDKILEEERRMFYVAVTRTKDVLKIFYPKDKQSSFIDEMKANKEEMEKKKAKDREKISGSYSSTCPYLSKNAPNPTKGRKRAVAI